MKGRMNMSLLNDFAGDEVRELAKKVFMRQFDLDPKLSMELDDKRKLSMFKDVLYNLSYLEIAIEFDDDAIFTDYAAWIYQLLVHLMKDLPRKRVCEHMVDHYRILNESLQTFYPLEKAKVADRILKKAIEATLIEVSNDKVHSYVMIGDFQQLKAEYLGYMLKGDTRKAIDVILRAVQSGIGVEDIYINVFRDVMYEVGNLWHQNKISVDNEHYCTSVTQMAIAQFYSLIFDRPRNGRKVLTCCVGSELHEMGIRMVSDLFEYDGWDSHYLGAAVPKEAILKSITEFNPELVCLSVTMPHHLHLCRDIVKGIQERYPEVKIAVGGQAIMKSRRLWEKWNVDYSSESAPELIRWANNLSVGTH
jgi:methanogenic corrinoid protein MtbC1